MCGMSGPESIGDSGPRTELQRKGRVHSDCPMRCRHTYCQEFCIPFSKKIRSFGSATRAQLHRHDRTTPHSSAGASGCGRGDRKSIREGTGPPHPIRDDWQERLHAPGIRGWLSGDRPTSLVAGPGTPHSKANVSLSLIAALSVVSFHSARSKLALVRAVRFASRSNTSSFTTRMAVKCSVALDEVKDSQASESPPRTGAATSGGSRSSGLSDTTGRDEMSPPEDLPSNFHFVISGPPTASRRWTTPVTLHVPLGENFLPLRNSISRRHSMSTALDSSPHQAVPDW